MATNLDLDPDLLDEAQRIGQVHTKRETVHQALREYIARRRRLQAIEGFATLEFDPGWDHRAERKRR